MRFVPALCRCAIAAVVFTYFLSAASIAQFGRSQEPDENPFGEVHAENEAAEPEEASTAKSTPTPSLCLCTGEGAHEAVARINNALARPLKEEGLQFDDESLESVLNFLQEEYDLPIQLNVPALEDVGLSADEKVNINVQNVSLRSGLRLLLHPKQLTYVIQNEVLIVTTPDEAESILELCVYDVRDLANARSNTKEIEKLADVVIACIAHQTWAKNGGGKAEIRPLRPGLLVVAQTRAVHDEINGLFVAMRKVLATPPADSAPSGAMGGYGGRGGEMGRGSMMGRGGMGMESGFGGGFGGEYGDHGGRGGEGGGRGYGRSNAE